MKEIKVTKEFDNTRVDKVVLKILRNASKGFVYKMYRKKNILLNGKKITGKEKVFADDTLKFFFSDATFDKFSGSVPSADANSIEADALDESQIIYEDDDLLVYNKPVGMLSQPNGRNDNLVHSYESRLKAKGEEPGLLDSFGICNRLDRNTTGITLIGKNPRSLRLINEAILHGHTRKLYHAIVKGKLTQSLELKGYLTKSSSRNKVSITPDGPGDLIHTKVNPIQVSTDGSLTLVEVRILTGKSHQIRAHLSWAGHPLIGDGKYGDKVLNDRYRREFGIRYQLLHSYSYTLTMDHDELPNINKRPFTAPYFEPFASMVDRLF